MPEEPAAPTESSEKEAPAEQQPGPAEPTKAAEATAPQASADPEEVAGEPEPAEPTEPPEPAVVPPADAPPPAPVLDGTSGSDGEWYFQEQTTGQPAGPWTVEQLCARWRRNQINGLTPVWRRGLQGWRPLSEAQELKAALWEASKQSREGPDVEAADAEVSSSKAKGQKRVPLDEVPLTHTYTSEQGVLYVYDTVDADWKASDVYEALLREEAQLEDAATSRAPTLAAEAEAEPNRQPEAKTTQVSEKAPDDSLPPEAQKALEELLAEVANSDAAGAARGPAGKRPAPVAEPAAAGAGAADVPPLSDEQEAKRQKRRDYRERRKLKRQAGVFMKAHDNPNVYVSGLPPDVTAQELEVVMKRAGVLKVDPDTGGSKMRLYLDAEGNCKGDALVSYANAASVGLAVKFLHEFEFRPQCHLAVQQADFEDHEQRTRLSKQDLKELASKKKQDGSRAKYIAAKNQQKEAVSWSGEMDDGTGRRIVVLKHLFSAEEAEREGSEFYAELADEVREECEKIGQVAKVTPLERHRQGIVCVKFKSSSEAEECIRVMDGRFFAGRALEASFYDGKTDLRVLGVVKQPLAQDAASALDQAAQPSLEAPVSSVAATAQAPGADAQATAAPASTAAATSTAEAGATAPSGSLTSLPADQQAKSWEQWLDEQSSGSDSETRIRTEE